uniref:Ran GTPase activating protein 1 n=1 Tax=Panagrolaimus sp. JU765 TaxID=591449 RepID=A0AC34QIV8_9BILA
MFSSGHLSFKGRGEKWNSTDDGESIATEISSVTKLEVLELCGNSLGVDASLPIAEAMKKHPELKKALWSDLFTSRLNTEIPLILKTLCNSMIVSGTRLTVLDLSDNAIGPQAIGALEEFLSGPTCFALKELYLNNCGLGSAGINVAECLIKCHEAALRHNTIFDLQVFVAGRNRLENRGAKALAKAFKTLGTLVEVKMYQNGVKQEGISALAEAFEDCPNLKVLDLNDNTFGRRGAMQMARVVGKLTKLQVLNFGDCLCRRKGSESIVMNLAMNCSAIQELRLNGNEIDVETAQKIVQMCKSLPKITILDLQQNCYGRNWSILVSHFQKPFVDFGAESDDDGSRDGDTSEEESDKSDED